MLVGQNARTEISSWPAHAKELIFPMVHVAQVILYCAMKMMLLKLACQIQNMASIIYISYSLQRPPYLHYEQKFLKASAKKNRNVNLSSKKDTF